MKYFIVDGSEDCFFTAVFYAYNKPDGIITCIGDVQLGFDSQVTEVITDETKAERVKNKLYEIDPSAVDEIFLVLRSSQSNKEQIAYKYVKLIMYHKSPVRGMLSLTAVMDMLKLREKVIDEVQKVIATLHFMQNSEGVLYAPYSPENDITSLIAPHFAERFKRQKFVIHDTKRKIAAMYDGDNLVMFNADGADLYLSQYEKTFDDLWQNYYKYSNVTNAGKSVKGYMPVRYWKFLPENSDGENA